MGASLAIIEVERDKIVMISRRDNHEDFGIIGGKIDDGETPYQAMVREVEEECGLIVKSAFLLDERNYNGKMISCFYVTQLGNEKSVEDTIRDFNDANENSEVYEGVVKIGDFSEVMDSNTSYSDYNIVINQKKNSYLNNHSVVKAFESKTLFGFMDSLFPVNWGGIKARICETGVEFTMEDEPWLIGVSDIQKTVRKGKTYMETLLKSVLFISHDCFHNLWGLPFINDFSEKDFEYFKSAQMSGEIAVLCITEFILAKQIKKRHPELANIIDDRNATPMMNYGEELYQLSPRELVLKLDEILQNGNYKEWIHNTESGLEFFSDYIPMLQKDIQNISRNWDLMKENHFIPNAMPNVRYGRVLKGSQLTQFMIDDFMHMRSSDDTIDLELADFNRGRRKKMNPPSKWIY